VERSFRDLQVPDRQRPVTVSQHPGGSPWSATDHLAHIVESELGLLAIGRRLVAGEPDPVSISRRGKTSEERTEFVNRENQAQVLGRRGQSFDALLDELKKVVEERTRLIHGLTNEQLAQPVPGSERPDLSWGALLGSARHAQTHLAFVERALVDADSVGSPVNSPKERKV
jgi:hypothetical protein